MNNVNLVGGLVRDAELKYLNTGTAILTFSIAVSEYVGKDKPPWSNFFDCSMFGKRAESLAQYMGKGQRIAIEGILHQDRWEQEGANRSKVKIKVSNVDLVGAKKTTTQGQQASSQSQNSSAEQSSQGSFNGTPETFEDDTPF